MTKRSVWAIGVAYILAVLMILTAYIGLWHKSLGGYEPGEHWLVAVIKKKHSIALGAPGPKLLIAGGSSSMFGFDSEFLSELLSLPVVNLSSHAGLPLWFHLNRVLSVAKKGDIVLLPLEYEYYSSDRGAMSDWQVVNLGSWGWQFFEHLSLHDEVIHFRHSKFGDIVARLANEKWPEDVINSVGEDKQFSQGDGSASHFHGYDVKSVNLYGDLLVDRPISGELKKQISSGIAYIVEPIGVSKDFVSMLRSFDAKLTKRGVKLYLSWPPSIRNAAFDLTVNGHLDRAKSLQRILEKEGFAVLCSPLDFNLPANMFFDTKYHLNYGGALVRTATFRQCFKPDQREGLEREQWVTNKALERYNSQASKSLGPALIQIRDLKGIVAALEKHKKVFGSYPRSSGGWDGLMSDYGESGKEWIKGLVGNFIERLPHDPRALGDGVHQYLYRSDGRDFKLIAHGSEDWCDKVAIFWPNLIDPARNCWAFGFWTDAASNW